MHASFLCCKKLLNSFFCQCIFHIVGIPRPLPLNKKSNRDSFITDDDEIINEAFNVSKSKSIEDTEEFKKAVESFDQMFGGESCNQSPESKRVSRIETKKCEASPNVNWKRIKTSKSFEIDEQSSVTKESHMTESHFEESEARSSIFLTENTLEEEVKKEEINSIVHKEEKKASVIKEERKTSSSQEETQISILKEECKSRNVVSKEVNSEHKIEEVKKTVVHEEEFHQEYKYKTGTQQSQESQSSHQEHTSSQTQKIETNSSKSEKRSKSKNRKVSEDDQTNKVAEIREKKKNKRRSRHGESLERVKLHEPAKNEEEDQEAEKKKISLIGDEYRNPVEDDESQTQIDPDSIKNVDGQPRQRKGSSRCCDTKFLCLVLLNNMSK